MRLSPSSLSVLLGLALGTFVLVGCGGGDAPDIEAVTGTLTKDGVPFVGAKVEFYPEGHGAASYGTTDDEGNFTLSYSTGKPGAAALAH